MVYITKDKLLDQLHCNCAKSQCAKSIWLSSINTSWAKQLLDTLLAHEKFKSITWINAVLCNNANCYSHSMQGWNHAVHNAMYTLDGLISHLRVCTGFECYRLFWHGSGENSPSHSYFMKRVKVDCVGGEKTYGCKYCLLFILVRFHN